LRNHLILFWETIQQNLHSFPFEKVQRLCYHYARWFAREREEVERIFDSLSSSSSALSMFSITYCFVKNWTKVGGWTHNEKDKT
jgi:hypothetical protein